MGKHPSTALGIVVSEVERQRPPIIPSTHRTRKRVRCAQDRPFDWHEVEYQRGPGLSIRHRNCGLAPCYSRLTNLLTACSKPPRLEKGVQLSRGRTHPSTVCRPVTHINYRWRRTNVPPEPASPRHAFSTALALDPHPVERAMHEIHADDEEHRGQAERQHAARPDVNAQLHREQAKQCRELDHRVHRHR
jgi:hypothetical protein